MYGNGLGLKELVNLDDWQKVQDNFAEVLGVPLRTVDVNGKFPPKESNPSPLCAKINRNDPAYSRCCGDCALKKEKRLDVRTAFNLKCPFGLDIFVIPISAFSHRTVAHIITGPIILNARRSRQEYEEYARSSELDIEDLMDALVEINVFSHSKMRSITKLLSDIFSHMAQTGYHKKRLGEITPEVIEVDPLFSKYYEEKVLDALLNTCSLALNADSGSVMTVDKKTHMLHIKVASKLDDDIVNNTNLKVGEGIAGLAAQTARPIVLPKDRNKNGLKNKMKRQYIKSSMIVPFTRATNHDVYGVLNLNVVRRKKDFSEKDIAFVKELTNLARIALIPVK